MEVIINDSSANKDEEQKEIIGNNNNNFIINEDEKNILLINNNSDYLLNIYFLINRININKNIHSKKSENEFILNLLLMSSKLNKSNKLICLLLLFYLNQDEKKGQNYINYLFSKISKLLLLLDKDENLENYILLKESSFLQNQNQLFYSKDYLNQIKSMLVNKNTDKKLVSTIDNLSEDIDKRLKTYLESCKNQFTNRSIMNNNRLNRLKELIELLCSEKNEISDDAPIYLINKEWVFKTKLFIDPFFEARKENLENLLIENSFDVEKVYHSYTGKQDKSNLKNLFGVIFPGPINNYEMLDLKDQWFDPLNLEENIIIKSNLKLNDDYFLINENDWNFMKEIFDTTNEIKRKKKDENFYKIKILIIDPRLALNENEYLLKRRFIQINLDSNITDFKKKIIRCLEYDINKDMNCDSIEENEVVFYLVNKENKDILIEICISLKNNNKIYQSLYIQQIKIQNDEESIKNFFNYFDKSKYILIAEIIPKDTLSFIHPIIGTANKSNIYNCSVCNELINLSEKYNCSLCNMSLFCSKQCADISEEHRKLHELLNQIYHTKFNLKQLLKDTEIILSKDNSGGMVCLEKDKYNSCINSIIQCLSNNLDLTKYFLYDFYKNDMNITDYLTTNGNTLSQKYFNLMKEMWLSNKINKNVEVSHKNFVKLIIKNMKLDINNLSSMNNIHEILLYLLNGLHKELNRYVNIENNDEKKSEDNDLNSYQIKDNSIITDLFQGIYQSSLSCSKCGNVSMVYDFFKNIILPIPKKNNNLIIKYFNEFECKYMRYVMDDNTTIKHLKDRALNNLSDKIKHIVSIMTLTDLIDVTAFDTDDEKILTYTTMYNSIELVQFDKNKVLTKVYVTRIKKPKNNNETTRKNRENDKENETTNSTNTIKRNDLGLQLSRIYKESDVELVFYEKSVIEKKCVNIYVYPFLYNEKEKINKNRDRLYNAYPIAISVSLSLILENFEYLVNVKLRDLLIDHFKEESEKREVNYIELVVPHFFCNSSYYSQANCLLCKEKKKNSLFCPLFSSIDKNLTIKDLLKLYDYPNQPIFLLAKCKYYDIKKRIYSNMDSFAIEKKIKKQEENKIDIYDCFELYTRREEIRDIDWQCESCNSIQIPYKQLLIHKPPLYLIIQFDRCFKKYSSFRSSYAFDDTLINFPINNLDIDEYVEGPEKYKTTYNLYGAIYREVSSRNDNIYCVCKNNKKWIMFKDNKAVGVNGIVNKFVHFLFYRRSDLQD